MIKAAIKFLKSKLSCSDKFRGGLRCSLDPHSATKLYHFRGEICENIGSIV